MKNWDSVARRYVEHDTTAQETFGPIGDIGSLDNPGWILTGADQKTGVNTYTLVEVGAAPTPPTLDSLRNLPGFTYLGSPYSKYHLGHDMAAYEVSYAAALLMRRGLVIYAPITHGHSISRHAALPMSWEFWKRQCQPMIDAASALVVLQMADWQESVGLVYEIGEFERTGRPIVYLEPAALVERVAA